MAETLLFMSGYVNKFSMLNDNAQDGIQYIEAFPYLPGTFDLGGIVNKRRRNPEQTHLATISYTSMLR